jgi:UDP-glucose:(heptosyl)LPS alpha-1,3-glucosyltransferase
VLPEPFSQAHFVARLREAHDAQRQERWSENAVRYGETADIYRGLPRAAAIIAGAA